MPWTLTDNQQTHPFESIDALLIHLRQLEQAATPDSVVKKLILQGEAFGADEPKSLARFLVSKERVLAFEVDLQGMLVTAEHRQWLSYSYFVQSQRLNDLRLLPRALELISQPEQLRHAKVSLVRGETRGHRHIAMQQQQQQQQQMAVQAKRYQPNALVLSSGVPAYEAHADLTQVITAANIEATLGEFWATLPYSQDMTVTEAWHLVVGMTDAVLLEGLQLRAPMVQCVQMDAMKVILSHFSEFTGGVVPHNLPEGFFWMKHPERNHWVLCFDDVDGKAWRETPVNPLTLHCRAQAQMPTDITSDRILQLLVFRCGKISDELTEHVFDYHARLNDQALTKQEKIQALSYFLSLFAEGVPVDILTYCHHKLETLSTDLHDEDMTGLGHLLFSHGVSGVAVFLSYVEKVLEMDNEKALPLLRKVYLTTPGCYASLMTAAGLTALDGLCQLNQASLRWWWHGVRNSEASSFTEDVASYLYFLKEVHAIMGVSKLAWKTPLTPFPRQPLKVTLDYARWILQHASCPKEQFELLPGLSWRQWDDYFASYQHQFALVSRTMNCRVGDGFNGDYRVSSLFAQVGTPYFNRSLERFIGMQRWRAGSWGEFASMKNTIEDWVRTATTCELVCDRARMCELLRVLFTVTLVGKRACESTVSFENIITHALNAFSSITRHNFLLSEVMKNISEVLPQFEETALAGHLTLVELAKGISTIFSDLCITELARIDKFSWIWSMFAKHGRDALSLFSAIKMRIDWDERQTSIFKFSWDMYCQLVTSCHPEEPSLWPSRDEILFMKFLVFIQTSCVINPAANIYAHFTKHPLHRTAHLKRITAIDFEKSTVLYHIDALSQFVKTLGWYFDIEEALKDGLPKGLVFIHPGDPKTQGTLEASDVYFTGENELEKVTDKFVTFQQDLKTMRLTLPTRCEEHVKSLREALIEAEKVGENETVVEQATRVFQGVLLGVFKDDYPFFFKKEMELAHLFLKNPYQLSVLEPVLLEVGRKIKELRTGWCWKPVKAAKFVFWATFDNEDLRPFVQPLFPEANHDKIDLSKVTSFLKSFLDWSLALLKEDALTWFEPLISCSFDILKWVDESKMVLSTAMFDDLLLHLQAFERALIPVLGRPIHQHAILGWLRELQVLLKGSYFERNIELLLFLLTDNHLSTLISLATPFLRAYGEMVLLSTGQPEQETLFYEAMARCEKAGVALYQLVIRPPYHVVSVINEWVAYFDGKVLQEINEAGYCDDEQKAARYATYKARVEEELMWWRQPTASCTALYRHVLGDSMLSHFAWKVRSLAMKHDDANRFLYQLVRHYLGSLDVALPIHEALLQIKTRYIHLCRLLDVVGAFNQRLPLDEFATLTPVLLNHYEKGGHLEGGTDLLVLLYNCPYQKPMLLFQALCEVMTSGQIPSIKELDACFYHAMDNLEKALQGRRDLDLDHRQEVGAPFYVQVFIDSYTLHPLLPKDKVKRWKMLETVDQRQLEGLINQLISTSLNKNIETRHPERSEGSPEGGLLPIQGRSLAALGMTSGCIEPMVTALVTCLENYIDECPQVVSCLNQVIQSPLLQTCWMSFPTDREKGRAWIGFVAALSELGLTEDQYNVVSHVFKTCSSERLQALLQPFAYHPHPSTTRYLDLLASVDSAYQDKILAWMAQDPIWASSPFKGRDDAPTVRCLDHDKKRISEVLKGITPQVAGMMESIKEEAKLLRRMLPPLLTQSLPELCSLQIAKQREMREENATQVSRVRLEWLAIISVIMSKTTGTIEGILPNSTQLIAVLLSWHTQGHLLMQLNTSEGKSYVTALLAAWEWVRVGTVDVISSNQGLVLQDFVDKGLRYFFEALQIPAGILRSGEGQTYQAGKVYYTTPWDRAFIASEYFMATHRKLKIKVAGVGDECDLLLLKMLLTFDYVRSLHGENHLEWVYPLIVDFIALPAFRQIHKTNGHRVWARKHDVVELKRYMARQSLSEAQQAQWDDVCANEWQLNRWISAACEASLRLKFLVSPDEKHRGYHAAVPIVGDVPQAGAWYSRAVHCFLHVLLQRKFKDKCFYIPEEVSAVDTDYPLGLVAIYERFIGLSATLGPEKAQQYLQSKLGVSSFILPPHVPSQLTILPRQLCANANEHAKAIAARVHASSEGASYLIIEDESEHVEAMNRHLQSLLDSGKYTIQTVIGNESASTLQAILVAAEQPNVVTICTRLFSRGKDLHPHIQLGAILACFMESENEVQAWGRAGRFGQKGEACTIIDASRYGFEGVLTASRAEQDEHIQQCQVRLSQEEAVERYYSQEATLLRAGALSWFDKGMLFLLQYVQPEQQDELKRHVLACRQQWIERMVELWEEALLETDPDCMYENLYVRRTASGELDVAFLESLLQAYPGLIQHAWVQLRQEMLKLAYPCLQDLSDHVHAVHQAKWLFEVQDMAEQVRLHQLTQVRLPAKGVVHYLNHTGFGSQEVSHQNREPVVTPSYARKMQFFKTWQQQVQDKRSQPLALLQALQTVEQQPFPWQLPAVELPHEMLQAIAAISRFEQVESAVGHADVDNALDDFQALQALTLEKAKGHHNDALSYFGDLADQLDKSYQRLRDDIDSYATKMKTKEHDHQEKTVQLAAVRQAILTLKDAKVSFVDKIQQGRAFDVQKDALKQDLTRLMNEVNQMQVEKNAKTVQMIALGQRKEEVRLAFECARLEQCALLKEIFETTVVTARLEAIEQCRVVSKTCQQRIHAQLRQYDEQEAEVVEIQETEQQYQGTEHVVGRLVVG
ncbi:MAG: hypothetical protein NTW08_08685 [Gammaproteobacteria bacterium]|nr:hypothetical protein [Gammaproteobacteria bacterium]